MRMLLSSVLVCVLTVSGAALADDTKPIELSAAQMDLITAGGLGLPNGKDIFVGLDNPAPGDNHPTFERPFGRASTTAKGVTGVTSDPTKGGKGPPNSQSVFGNEGPWSAHYMSPVIDLVL